MSSWYGGFLGYFCHCEPRPFLNQARMDIRKLRLSCYVFFNPFILPQNKPEEVFLWNALVSPSCCSNGPQQWSQHRTKPPAIIVWLLTSTSWTTAASSKARISNLLHNQTRHKAIIKENDDQTRQRQFSICKAEVYCCLYLPLIDWGVSADCCGNEVLALHYDLNLRKDTPMIQPQISRSIRLQQHVMHCLNDICCVECCVCLCVSRNDIGELPKQSKTHRQEMRYMWLPKENAVTFETERHDLRMAWMQTVQRRIETIVCEKDVLAKDRCGMDSVCRNSRYDPTSRIKFPDLRPPLPFPRPFRITWIYLHDFSQ